MVNAVRVLDCQSNKLIDSDTLYALSLVLMDAVRVPGQHLIESVACSEGAGLPEQRTERVRYTF